MPYSESKQLTDTEKRLQTIKTQLFGKEGNLLRTSTHIQIHKEAKNAQPQNITYLRNDLSKILILATLAIGVQLILYLQFTFKILKFN